MKGSLYHDRGSRLVEKAISFIKPRFRNNVKRRLPAVERMVSFSGSKDSTHHTDFAARVGCVLARTALFGRIASVQAHTLPACLPRQRLFNLRSLFAREQTLRRGIRWQRGNTRGNCGHPNGVVIPASLQESETTCCTGRSRATPGDCRRPSQADRKDLPSRKQRSVSPRPSR